MASPAHTPRDTVASFVVADLQKREERQEKRKKKFAKLVYGELKELLRDLDWKKASGLYSAVFPAKLLDDVREAEADDDVEAWIYALSSCLSMDKSAICVEVAFDREKDRFLLEFLFNHNAD